MKKVLLVLGILFGVVLAAFAGLLIQAGLFFKVQVTESMSGPFTLVYQEVKGDYAQAGKVGMDIYQKLVAEDGITTTKGFGIYFDDPKTVAKDQLRSEVGCILEGDNIKKAEMLKSKFKVKTIEAKKSLVATHPFTSPLSIMLGIVKVYPAFSEKLGNKPSGYTMSMEIYDMPNKMTIYLMR